MLPMQATYKAAIVGCSRIGAFIDNEVIGRPDILLPYSHAAGYEACERTDLVAGADLRPDVGAAGGGGDDNRLRPVGDLALR